MIRRELWRTAAGWVFGLSALGLGATASAQTPAVDPAAVQKLERMHQFLDSLQRLSVEPGSSITCPRCYNSPLSQRFHNPSSLEQNGERCGSRDDMNCYSFAVGDDLRRVRRSSRHEHVQICDADGPVDAVAERGVG